MKIYIVYGVQLISYDCNEEWNVCAYTDKSVAEAHRDAANAEAERCEQECGETQCDLEYSGSNKYDPKMDTEYWYSRPYYYVSETELLDSFQP